MKNRASLYRIIFGRFVISKLFSGIYEPLLNRRDAFFLFNTFFDPINSVGWFDINLDFFSSECLHLDHGSTSEPEDKMKSRLFLDVVIS